MPTNQTDRELLEAAARKAGVLSDTCELGDSNAGLMVVSRPMPGIWPMCTKLTMAQLLRIVRAAAEIGGGG